MFVWFAIGSGHLEASVLLLLYRVEHTTDDKTGKTGSPIYFRSVVLLLAQFSSVQVLDGIAPI